MPFVGSVGELTAAFTETGVTPSVGLTANSIQGINGEFEAILNATVDTTGNQIQGVVGDFKYVIDNSNAET